MSRNLAGPNDYVISRIVEGDEVQDVAEYAVVLAVILAIAAATIRMIRSQAGQCVRQRWEHNS